MKLRCSGLVLAGDLLTILACIVSEPQSCHCLHCFTIVLRALCYFSVFSMPATSCHTCGSDSRWQLFTAPAHCTLAHCGQQCSCRAYYFCRSHRRRHDTINTPCIEDARHNIKIRNNDPDSFSLATEDDVSNTSTDVTYSDHAHSTQRALKRHPEQHRS